MSKLAVGDRGRVELEGVQQYRARRFLGLVGKIGRRAVLAAALAQAEGKSDLIGRAANVRNACSTVQCGAQRTLGSNEKPSSVGDCAGRDLLLRTVQPGNSLDQ